MHKEADVIEVHEVGDVITYTIIVTNTSNFAIDLDPDDDGEYDINDENIDNLSYVSGDTNNNDLLDVDEIWVFEGTLTITLEIFLEFGLDEYGNFDNDGNIENIAEVCGQAPDGIEECNESNIVIVDLDFVFIPDAFSPDGDDVNETFEIIGLHQHYPNFTLQVFNRWGNKVYDYENKGSTDPEWWDGISNGRAVVKKNVQVPTGTYYFILDYNDGVKKPLIDWIYIKKD